MQEDIFSVKNKVVLITGSSRGLGFTFAKAFAENGARVVLNGRNRESLEEAKKKMAEMRLTVYTSTFDVFDEEAVEREIKQLEKSPGPVDVLINNAGIQRRAPLEELALKDWEEVLKVNLSGAFIVSKAIVPHMIQQKKGKIINTCSLMSELGRNTTGAYAAAKGGLKMLTRAMTVEWAKHNIQINGIGPGYFATEMTKKLVENEEFNSWITGRTPAGRWGNPEELCGTALYLASDASNFVNGQIIYVDGGLLSAI
ncbi:MAG: SDR family NAD(P)-dependent oxidoreductase [Bacteroidota bacterium]